MDTGLFSVDTIVVEEIFYIWHSSLASDALFDFGFCTHFSSVIFHLFGDIGTSSGDSLIMRHEFVSPHCHPLTHSRFKSPNLNVAIFLAQRQTELPFKHVACKTVTEWSPVISQSTKWAETRFERPPQQLSRSFRDPKVTHGQPVQRGEPTSLDCSVEVDGYALRKSLRFLNGEQQCT